MTISQEAVGLADRLSHEVFYTLLADSDILIRHVPFDEPTTTGEIGINVKNKIRRIIREHLQKFLQEKSEKGCG